MSDPHRHQSDQGSDRQNVTVSAEKQRQEDSGREDPVEPDEVGTAKETTTVRGHGESQSVRHSG